MKGSMENLYVDIGLKGLRTNRVNGWVSCA